MDKNEFLHDYSDLAVNVEEDLDVDVDDSITKDSTLNGEAEVKANGVSESENGEGKEAEKNTDVAMDEILAEKKADEIEKDKSSEEVAVGSTDIASDANKANQIETESSAEESIKTDEKIDATPASSEVQENVPSENVPVNDINTSEKETTEEKAPEANPEDKPDETEKAVNNPEEKLEIQPTPDETSTEKAENNEVGDKTNSENEQNETVKDDAVKTNESGSGDATDNKEVTNPTADDDNKEIDAIDKLLAEGTAEDKPESESKPEDMETSAEPTTEVTAKPTTDTNDKTAETEQTVETNKEETTTNENTEAVPSKEDDTPKTDAEMNEDSTSKSTESLTNGSVEEKEKKRKLSTEETEETHDVTKKPKLDSSACMRPKSCKRKYRGATFWPSHFRQKLCTCNECITIYKDLSVLFLTDMEDTVTAYEDLGKAKTNGAPSTQYEKGLEALSSLDRIQQINALTEYNRMRDKLLDFLKSFKDRKEVVKEEDIKAFFADMKPKREPDGVYFCR